MIEKIPDSNIDVPQRHEGWEQLGVPVSAADVLADLEQQIPANKLDAEVATLVDDTTTGYGEGKVGRDDAKLLLGVGLEEIAKDGDQSSSANAVNRAPDDLLEPALREMEPDKLGETLREIETAEAATNWLREHVETVEQEPMFTFSLDDDTDVGSSVEYVERLKADESGVPKDLMPAIAQQLVDSGRAQLLADNLDKFTDLGSNVADNLSSQQLINGWDSFANLPESYLKEHMELSGADRSLNYSNLPADMQDKVAAEQIENGGINLDRFSDLSDSIAIKLIQNADIDKVVGYKDKFNLSDELEQKLAGLSADGPVKNRSYIDAFPGTDQVKLALKNIDWIRKGDDIESALAGLTNLDGEVIANLADKVEQLRKDNDIYGEKYPGVLFRNIDSFNELDDEAARILAASIKDTEHTTWTDMRHIAEHPEVFTGEAGVNFVKNAEYVTSIDDMILVDEVYRRVTKFDTEILLSDQTKLADELYYSLTNHYGDLHLIEQQGDKLGFSTERIDKVGQLRKSVLGVGKISPDTILKYIDVRQDDQAFREQADRVISLAQRIAGSRSEEVTSFADSILSAALETDDPEGSFAATEEVFVRENYPDALKRLDVFTILREFPVQDIARYSPVFAAQLEKDADPIGIIRDDLIRASMSSNNSSLRSFLEYARDSKDSAVMPSAGINRDPQEMLAEMDEIIAQSDKRNREFAQNGHFVPQEGDLIKGIVKKDQMAWLPDIMQTGSLAREFLGASSDSDNTPLDTDLGMVAGKYASLKESVDRNDAREYGDVYFVLRDRDNRWSSGVDEPQKLEVLDHGVAHRGIRTGFGMAEVDYLAVNSAIDAEERKAIARHIAEGGFYIPVIDIETEQLVLTPEQFDEMREQSHPH